MTCTPKRVAELTVVLVHDVPFVTLTVNGMPATFILDTGAERSIVTTAAAERLGLRPEVRISRQMRGIGGTVGLNLARMDSLEAAGDRLPDTTILVGASDFPRIGGETPDGLLGGDVLSDFDLDLDVPDRRLVFYDPAACPGAEPPWHPQATLAANRSLHDRLFFPVTLDGKALTAFIDTGAQNSVIDTSAALSTGVTQARLRGDPAAVARGASTQMVQLRRHQFGVLNVGGELVRDPSLLVTPLDLNDADIVLGMDFVASRRVWLSYQMPRVFVGRPLAGS